MYVDYFRNWKKSKRNNLSMHGFVLFSDKIITKQFIPLFGSRRPIFGYFPGWGISVFRHRIYRSGRLFVLKRKTYLGGDARGGLVHYDTLILGPIVIEWDVRHESKEQENQQ